jgi:hypothetical protein
MEKVEKLDTIVVSAAASMGIFAFGAAEASALPPRLGTRKGEFHS